MIRSRRRAFTATTFLCLLCAFAFLVSATLGDDGAEFVKEVVEEDDTHNDFDNAYMDDADVEKLKKEAEERLQKEGERKLMEQERLQNEAAERLQQEMDAKFERDLKKMNDDERKAALKQRKRDSKIVQRVLKAARTQNLYGILGVRNFFAIEIPSRQMKIGKFSVRIPGFKLFHASPTAIKKSYRAMSKVVHPDKNRDARASQAFVAVENAAQVLTNTKSRQQYDNMRTAENAKFRRGAMAVVKRVMDRVFAFIGRIITIFRKVLGPFSFPVFLLGIIII